MLPSSLRPSFRLAALLSIAAMILANPHAAHAQSASTWNKRGHDAEAREDVVSQVAGLRA